jgi:hypothetical protein
MQQTAPAARSVDLPDAASSEAEPTGRSQQLAWIAQQASFLRQQSGLFETSPEPPDSALSSANAGTRFRILMVVTPWEGRSAVAHPWSRTTNGGTQQVGSKRRYTARIEAARRAPRLPGSVKPADGRAVSSAKGFGRVARLPRRDHGRMSAALRTSRPRRTEAPWDRGFQPSRPKPQRAGRREREAADDSRASRTNRPLWPRGSIPRWADRPGKPENPGPPRRPCRD